MLVCKAWVSKKLRRIPKVTSGIEAVDACCLLNRCPQRVKKGWVQVYLFPWPVVGATLVKGVLPSSVLSA